MANDSVTQSVRTMRMPCGLEVAHVTKAETTFAYKEISKTGFISGTALK